MAKKKAKRAVSNEAIYAKLEHIEKLLAQEEREEEFEISELEKLEKLEEAIKEDVSVHPLSRITYHDITKGLIGAFVGVVGHFAFFYGHHIAEELTYWRAGVLLAVSLLLLIIFLYFSGFRRVKEYNKYLWIRVATIYVVALFVATSVLFLFGVLHFPPSFEELYFNVSAVSILAVMGAATADLIGGE